MEHLLGLVGWDAVAINTPGSLLSRTSAGPPLGLTVVQSSVAKTLRDVVFGGLLLPVRACESVVHSIEFWISNGCIRCLTWKQANMAISHMHLSRTWIQQLMHCFAQSIKHFCSACYFLDPSQTIICGSLIGKAGCCD